MFFCEPDTNTVGNPDKARHCRCDRPWACDDACVKCGHLWQWVIDRTHDLHGAPKPEPHEATGPLSFVSPGLAGVAL